MKIKRPSIEIGQSIWINRQTNWTESIDNLSEYKVVGVNTSSVYVKQGEGKYPLKLKKSNLEYRDGHLYRYQGYLSPEDYWNPIKEREKKKDLIKEINQLFKGKSLEDLEMIKKYIEPEDE